VSARQEITVLIQRSLDGDRDASDRLIRLVYDELKQRAHGQRIRWHGNLTMNTTALVHEAYIKLLGTGVDGYNNRGHFMATASTAMRQILVDYARKASAEKRGGDIHKTSIDGELGVGMAPDVAAEVLDLNDALERLEQEYPDLARVVECRAFTGLTVEDTADALEIGTATVKRRWAMAKSWLRRELSPDTGDPE
jgi:RNA polymerase sigma factor (TIGR02999 family)